MHRIATLILIVLAGCTQSADNGGGDDCSMYAVVILPPSDHPVIAVGGDARYVATVADSCNGPGLTSTFGAVSADPSVVTAHVEGQDVVLHAAGPGTTMVTVTSSRGLTASIQATTAVLDHVQLGSHEDGVPDAFLVGAPIAAVNLLAADGSPLVDTSMTITGAPSTITVNEVAIDGLAVGDHPLAITAGGASWSATVHVVATIDEVVSRAATVTFPLSQPGQAEHVCFDARLAGQVVAGAPWQFTFPSDHAAAGGRPNCVDVQSDTPVSFTVTASALGKTTSTQVTFQ